IDVMSVHSLILQKTGLLGDLESDKVRSLYCTATAGSARESLRPFVQSHIEQKRAIFTAFDNDPVGRQMTAFVKEVANNSSPDATVINLSDLLVLLSNNLKDFNNLWIKF
ncbi:hypothetical protein ADL19_19970, partial [Streptomyces purpurogeneiscleroticus]